MVPYKRVSPSKYDQNAVAAPVHSGAYQIAITSEPIDPVWDHFLATTPGGHHVQSSFWAQVKAPLGWQATRIAVHQAGRIIAGAQVLLKSLPMAGSVAYVQKGPLLAQDDAAVGRLVLDQLHEVAKAHRVVYLIVHPPETDTIFTPLLCNTGFGLSTVDVGPTATVRLDLTQDLDAILARMKPKIRYNIRLSDRRGISVREGTRQDLSLFYQSLVATSERRQFLPYPESYFDVMERWLGPYGSFQLFIASYQDEPVATILTVPFGDTVIYKKGGWWGQHRERHPNEALHWAAIQWAKSHGYRYYDFEGIDPAAAELVLQGAPLPEPMRQSVTRFKLGFGGEVRLLPKPYDYLYNPLLRWTYRTIYPKVAGLTAMQKLRDLAHKR